MSPSETLSRILRSDDLLSVEVVPGKAIDWSDKSENVNFPFLYRENHLGIPHRELLQLYLEASVSFQDFLTKRNDNLSDLELECITLILLLTNPEHTTALNFRRQLIEKGHIDSIEEHRMTWLLLSGIKEASKSSALWHHRRWIIWHIFANKTIGISFPRESLEAVRLSPDRLHKEFCLASKASEMYPRNYFSTLHRYKCLQSLLGSLYSPSTSDDVMIQYIELLLEERHQILQWMKSHISDYTMMNYFISVERSIASLLTSDTLNRLDNRTKMQDIKLSLHAVLSSTLTIIEELLISYPRRESLWLFLRSICIARSYQLSDTNSATSFLTEALEMVKSIEVSTQSCDSIQRTIRQIEFLIRQ